MELTLPNPNQISYIHKSKGIKLMTTCLRGQNPFTTWINFLLLVKLILIKSRIKSTGLLYHNIQSDDLYTLTI